MKTREAYELGRRVLNLAERGQRARAYARLAPVLAEKTPFSVLGHIGSAVGEGSLAVVNSFLEEIAAHKTMGGWVIIGAVLGQQLERDLAGAFERCRGYVVEGGVWYAVDILGERVPGPALVAEFETSLALLAAWREDECSWVRRSAGVAVHFWAKRSRGAPELTRQARTLLDFLEPMFGEWDMDAVKGVGWGLKTLGKYYPNLVADWLAQDIVPGQRKHRALMLRKTLTWLSDEQRARAMT